MVRVHSLQPKIFIGRDGFRHVRYPKNCATCGKKFWVARSLIRSKRKRYCSSKCAQVGSRVPRVLVVCGTCKKKFRVTDSRIRQSKSGLKFCSRTCKDKAQSLDGRKEIWPVHYGTASVKSYRRRAFRMYGKKCAKCGYDEYEEMLDVHHKDGRRRNYSIKNLEVLCVWCHYFEERVIKKNKLKMVG